MDILRLSANSGKSDHYLVSKNYDKPKEKKILYP